ncbi:MAG: hypothetical protein LBK61_04745 [Spirochaetaceae bacterium]|jgi:hypothetical protein|nr:hypothetical protein [Spirochaetaceae bacterium]
MRRTSAGLALLLFVLPVALHAHSLTLAGGTDNFVFDPNDTEAQNLFALPTLTLLVNAAIEGEFSPFSSYSVKFENDTVLRYLATVNTTFNLWAFRLGFGAFMSVLNEGSDYVPGAIGSLGLEIPGLLLAYIEYGQNVFTDSSELGTTNVNYGKLEAALPLPFVLCRFAMERKSFTMMPAETYTIRDSLLSYRVSFDFFSKLSTFQLTLGGGVKTLEKSIEPVLPAGSSIQPMMNELPAQFAFARFTFTPSPGFELFLDGEIPVSSTNTALFFKALAGFKITLSDF